MLLGKDATETGFKKQPLDQFRILHLAVHGFADTQYPEWSALVLGADPQSSDDGLLASAAVSAMLDRLLHHGHVLKCGLRSRFPQTARASVP